MESTWKRESFWNTVPCAPNQTETFMLESHTENVKFTDLFQKKKKKSSSFRKCFLLLRSFTLLRTVLKSFLTHTNPNLNNFLSYYRFFFLTAHKKSINITLYSKTCEWYTWRMKFKWLFVEIVHVAYTNLKDTSSQVRHMNICLDREYLCWFEIDLI